MIHNEAVKRVRDEEEAEGYNLNSKRVKTKENETDGSPPQEQSESCVVQKSTKESVRRCPYLGTINRHVLDFDFEKLCSVSLTNLRPYGCLICGKYFQGRGKNTHAMMHALESQHYIFINLHDTKVYCLPENYEVIDAALNDIKYHLNPTYTKEMVYEMSTVARYGKALDGTDYIPGCIGLNNLKQTDYFNVIIQLISTVIPLRNHFLMMDLSHQQSPDPVLYRLGELIRKMYNPQNFKGIVSPHEFLQAVGVASQKRFRIGQQQDPLAFLSWLLQRLKKIKKENSKESLIRYCFETEFFTATSSLIPGTTEETPPEESVIPALFMMLKVPPAPIFKDPLERNTIPQLPIFDLLQKFDGSTALEPAPGKFVRYSIWKLAPYLIVHINRFSRNNFFLEKNPTVVTFPVKNFDLRDYVHPLAHELNPVTRYDLVANIFHEGRPEDGQYKCHIFHSATKAWYEIEDLRVVPTLPQMVALSESYVQLYQRQDVRPDGSVDSQFTMPMDESRKRWLQTIDFVDHMIWHAVNSQGHLRRTRNRIRHRSLEAMEANIPSLPSDVSDPYIVLDILHTATEKDIRRAYRKKARNIHPDKNLNDPEADAKFRRLQTVYEFLLHKKARKLYDEKVFLEQKRRERFNLFDESRKRFMDELQEREKKAKESSQNTSVSESTLQDKSKASHQLDKMRLDNELWIKKQKEARQSTLHHETSCTHGQASQETLSHQARGYLEVSWIPSHESTPPVPTISYEGLHFAFSTFGVPHIAFYDVVLGKSFVEFETREKNLEAGLYFLQNRTKFPFLVKFRKENISQVLPDKKKVFTTSLENHSTQRTFSLEKPSCSSEEERHLKPDLPTDLASFELTVMDRLKQAVKRQKSENSSASS